MSRTSRAAAGQVPALSRARWSSVAALVLATLVASPAMAQEGGPAAVRVPTGPPDWVVVGTQVTYHYAQASLPGGVYELVEDPAGPLTDPATGKRYRESYSGTPTGQGGGTGSGDGFVQWSVSAIDGDEVLLSSTNVHNDPLSGTRYLGPGQVMRAPAATPGVAWAHPAILAGYRSDAPVGRLVLTGDVAVGGTTYQAISLVDPTPGAYSLLTFDTATGVLLRSASRFLPEAGGSALLGTMELAGIRRLATPGLGASAPAWLTGTTALRYAGTQVMTNIFDGSSQQYPMDLEVTFPEVGQTWARYASRVVVRMVEEVASTGEGLVAGVGPYWWDPTALAAMTPGQVLDTDPVTGVSITVSEVGQGPMGPAVALDLRMNGWDAQTAWDVGTGVMLAQAMSTRATGMSSQVQLQQMP